MKRNIIYTAALAMAAGLSSPAISSTYFTESQNFNVVEVSHGSTGPFQGLTQFTPDPTLRLHQVIINWSGYVSSSFNQHDDESQLQYYDQSYHGILGFWIGSDDPSVTADASASASFSGHTPCLSARCAVEGISGGSATFGRAGFVGNGVFSVNLIANITPDFVGEVDWDDVAVIEGTITYVYSAAVPEPASWAMILGGFGAIGGAMRSRRKAAFSFG